MRGSGASRGRGRAATAALAVALAVGAGGAARAEGGVGIPVFQLATLGGETFDSEQRLSERVVLISFWRPNQSRSARLLAELERLRVDFSGAADVEIVSVVSGDVDLDQARELVEGMHLGFPVLLDPERTLYGAFEVIVSPTSWFVDARGVQRFKLAGYRRDFPEVARAHLDVLLGKISEQRHIAQLARAEPRSPKHPVRPFARRRLALKFLERGKDEAAKVQFRLAWESGPDGAPAGVDLGLLLLREGEAEEAMEILSEVAELLGNDARAIGAKGLALVRVGRPDEGVPLLAQALEAEVPEPLFYYEMGRHKEQEGALGEALQLYKQGLELTVQHRPDSGSDPTAPPSEAP